MVGNPNHDETGKFASGESSLRKTIKDAAAKTKMFGTAAEAREHLVSLGYPPFRKGMVAGEVIHPSGKKARIGMALMSRTGQSSMGAAAHWGYTVTEK